MKYNGEKFVVYDNGKTVDTFTTPQQVGQYLSRDDHGNDKEYFQRVWTRQAELSKDEFLNKKPAIQHSGNAIIVGAHNKQEADVALRNHNILQNYIFSLGDAAANEANLEAKTQQAQSKIHEMRKKGYNDEHIQQELSKVMSNDLQEKKTMKKYVFEQYGIDGWEPYAVEANSEEEAWNKLQEEEGDTLGYRLAVAEKPSNGNASTKTLRPSLPNRVYCVCGGHYLNNNSDRKMHEHTLKHMRFEQHA